MVDRIRVPLPLGRVVQGDLYKANDKDFDTGLPRVYPQGHRLAGQPKITYFFAIAIKKQGEQHWCQTSWGKPIWEFGYAAWPKLTDQNPNSPRRGFLPDDFAWKIEDGDDQKPHKPQKGRPGRVNAQTEGMPGHWIVGCSSTFPPKILDTGFMPITEPNAVKRGFWVESVVTVDSNETDRNPGIYINGEFVMFKAIDKEIGGQAVDPRSIAGFGSSAVPSHLTAAGGGSPAMVGAPGQFPGGPSPSFPMPGAAPSGFPGALGVMPPLAAGPAQLGGIAPAAPAQPFPPGMVPNAMISPFNVPPAAPVVLPPGVTSVPGFLPNAAPAGPAGQAAMPGAPPPLAPPPGPQLTAKVPPGVTWAQMQAQGWTIDTARAQGYVA